MMKNWAFLKFSQTLSSVIPSWVFFKVESFSKLGRSQLCCGEFNHSKLDHLQLGHSKLGCIKLGHSKFSR
jgi:hypothetical protein